MARSNSSIVQLFSSNSKVIGSIAVNAVEKKTVRDEYLKIIESNDQEIKEKFTNIGKELMQPEESKEEIEAPEVTLYLNGKAMTFKKSVIMIGRKETVCDLVLPQITGLSRVHVILFITTDNIFILDPGSYHGISVNEDPNKTDHKAEKHSFFSYPNKEPITVNISLPELKQSLVINPITCAICWTNPRTITLPDCNHCVFCTECYEKRVDNRCPICRNDAPAAQNVLPVYHTKMIYHH
jgi:hypothetical protein